MVIHIYLDWIDKTIIPCMIEKWFHDSNWKQCLYWQVQWTGILMLIFGLNHYWNFLSLHSSEVFYHFLQSFQCNDELLLWWWWSTKYVDWWWSLLTYWQQFCVDTQRWSLSGCQYNWNRDTNNWSWTMDSWYSEIKNRFKDEV